MTSVFGGTTLKTSNVALLGTFLNVCLVFTWLSRRIIPCHSCSSVLAWSNFPL